MILTRLFLKQRRVCMLLFFTLITIPGIFAQIKITGKVTSSTGEALPGVNVLIKGTSAGTITDLNGDYSIEVKSENDVLVFSMVGMLSEEVPVKNQTVINVNLVEDLVGLDEVVVVGYGTMKKSDVTGAVSSISQEDIAATKTANAVQSIQGKAAGVDLVRSSGRAGSGYNVLIRGASTLSGSTDPLYIVDGAYYDGTIDIDPNDIASIDILKDASATAIYGPRGANGVIIITTKKGTSGKPSVSFNFYGGITSPLGNVPVMDRTQYLKYLKDVNWIESWQTDHSAVRDSADETWIFGARPWEQYGYDHGTDYNWRKGALRNGSQQSYNLGFSGGTDKLTYSASLDHYNEDGMIPNDNFKRYGARLNLEADLTKHIRAGINSIVNYTVNERGQFQAGQEMSPLISPYDTLGNLIPYPKSPDEDFLNPRIYQDRNYHFRENRLTRAFTTAYLKFSFLRWLNFKSSFNGDINYKREGQFNGIYPGTSGLSDANTKITQNLQWVWQNLLSGTKSMGEHTIQFTLGTETYSDRVEMDSISGQDLTLNNSQFYDLGGASQNIVVNSDLTLKTRIAALGRLHYTYANKYLLTGTFRYDGASQLADGHKWHVFPAVSAGWNLQKEGFMKNISVLSLLKLRAGWGVTGNESVLPYSTLGRLTNNPLYYEFGIQETPALGYRPDNASNPNLTWERTKGWNYGMDFGLFANRIQGVVDVYLNKTVDLLQEVSLPPSSGILTQTANIGSIQNRGLEISLKTININNSDFTWTTEFTFYANREKITELSSGRTMDELNGWFVGYPVKVYYDRKKIGVWQIGDTTGMDDYRIYGALPGNTKYLDVNEDTTISDLDRQVIGSRRPKWTGGLTSRFSYKNLDLNIFVYARIGQTVLDQVRQYGTFANARETPMAVDYWTPTNPTNDMPSPTYIQNRSGSPERNPLSYVDGSFVKIRDITLGYNFPETFVHKIGAAKLRIYITAQNAIVFGKFFHDGSGSIFKGNRYDPELEGSIGLPAPKMFGGGLNVTF